MRTVRALTFPLLSEEAELSKINLQWSYSSTSDEGLAGCCCREVPFGCSPLLSKEGWREALLINRYCSSLNRPPCLCFAKAPRLTQAGNGQSSLGQFCLGEEGKARHYTLGNMIFVSRVSTTCLILSPKCFQPNYVSHWLRSGPINSYLRMALRLLGGSRCIGQP